LAPDHPVSFSLVVLATREDAWDRGAIVRGFWDCPVSVWRESKEKTVTRRFASAFASSGADRAAIRAVAAADAVAGYGRLGIARGTTCLGPRTL
jgi:hypothetical protein